MRLGKAIRMIRAADETDIRTQAAEIGVSPATLSRIERGHPCDLNSVAKVFMWLVADAPATPQTETPSENGGES